jgi:hypothetical protein
MRRFIKWTQILAAASFFGTVLQFPGAGCVGKIVNNVNPCGTILNCDPLEYDLAFHDMFPDYAVDPTCTIPGFCGGTPFPPTGDGFIAPPPHDIGTGSGEIVTTIGATGVVGQ